MNSSSSSSSRSSSRNLFARLAGAFRGQPNARRAAGLGAFALLGAAAAALTPPASASTFNYGTTTTLRTINAGILQLDSAGQIENGQFNANNAQNDGLINSSGALYTFYVLDQRTDYKPAGWSFVNPLAPTTVTSDLLALFPKTYTTGQQVTKSMPVYWMVNLPSVANGYIPGVSNPLLQYDILTIRASNDHIVGLTRVEREMLRDYVDQGGTLWVEDAPGTNGDAKTTAPDADSKSNLPAGIFFDLAFRGGAAQGGEPYISDGAHRNPTLTVPNFLTYPEVDGLTYGETGLPSYLSSFAGAGTSAGQDFLSTVVGNTVASAGNYPAASVSAGDFGAGHIVVDDADILGGISEAVQPTANDNYTTRGTSAGLAPATLTAAQPSDLQYAYNVISWSGAESVTPGGDVRQSGAQTNATIGNSVVGTWSYPDLNFNNNATLQPAPDIVSAYGTAVSGNIAYVTSRDRTTGGTSEGVLHAFDIDPQEDLDQDGKTDDGYPSGSDPDFTTTPIPFTQDYSAGLSYDQLWAAQVANRTLSAPVVATLPAGVFGTQVNSTGYYNAVMVEDQTGRVLIYDATSNPGANGLTPIGTIGAAVANASFSGTFVPAPTYSHGWLIIPEPVPTTGSAEYPTVELYYLAQGTSNLKYNVELAGPAAGQTDTTNIVSAPAVAMVPSLDSNFGGSDLVAYVATQEAVYPLFLGARDEQGTANAPAAATKSFTTKLSLMQGNPATTTSPIQNVSTLVSAPEDAFGNNYSAYLSATDDWLYADTGQGHVPNFRPVTFNAATLNDPTNYAVTLASGDDTSLTSAYSDYDVVPTTDATKVITLSRHQIQAAVGGNASASTIVQGVAVGDDDTVYITVNEGNGLAAYVEAVQDQGPLLNSTFSNGTIVKWRYTLGNNSANAPSPFNTSNGGTTRIVGAPVVDKQHVYVLAVTAGKAYVLCFNHNATFDINVGAISEGTVTLQQQDENGTNETLSSQQFTITDSQNGIVQLTDFSQASSSVYLIAPNLSASIPITADVGNNTGGTSVPVTPNVNGSQLFQWISAANVNGNATNVGTADSQLSAVPGPLREVGSYLYFGNGTDGKTGPSQIVSVLNDSGGTAINTSVKVTQFTPVTDIDTPLAASGSNLIGAGSNGIVGMAYGGTMVADSSRLIEYAPDGSPMWALDSTVQQDPVADNTSNPPTSTTLATTNVSLSRPSSITVLAPNDILFADTGNNRCVRVDRGGNVLWELNSFHDPSGLLAPGQPLTLNDPTSVVEWRDNPIAAAGTTTPELTIEHYLVSDAGNDRVVEIDDYYTNGQIDKTDPAAYHVLVWTSHTFDKAGRSYRYVYASRYAFDTGAHDTFVLAGVANRQIAPLVVTGTTRSLDSASKDSAGSSIALLRYYPVNAPTGTTAHTVNGTQQTTYVAAAYSTAPATTAYTYGDPENGLPTGLITGIVYGTTQAAQTVVPVRNLRFVDAYTPVGQSGSITTTGTPANENIIVADDDGVFDGIAAAVNPNTGNFNIYAIQGYSLNGTPLNNKIAFYFTKAEYQALKIVSATPNPVPINAFAPTSAERLSNGDYLITNGASTGDATPYVTGTNDADVVNNALHFGGDVIEVSASDKTVLSPTTLFGRTNTGPTTDSNAPTGTPTTAPLSQPAFAVREQ